MAAAARVRATRPKVILALYAVLALIVVCVFVGQMFGWLKNPVAEKVRERRERDAKAKSESEAPASAVPAEKPTKIAPDPAAPQPDQPLPR